ncbi:MAG TPA: tRNA-dihydrouridine synthase family protein [Lentimicrobium sp.]|nr:tRNA-dihydrouridine synthase family protein [Lentimicrobium sp.]
MTESLNIYLAPFQSITTHTFRKVYSRHFRGVSKYYTPFFAKIDHESRLSARKERELQHLEKGYPEVVPQILSKDAAEIKRFARICAERGFKELNWNLGCPMPQVADKKRGSGMLPYPEMVDQLLQELMPDLPLKLSVKCRLGYLSPDEIFKLLPVFNSYPIHELTVHGRIGKQLYSGTVDLERTAEAYRLAEIPFVYNGDIFQYSDYQQVLELMPGIDHLMLGRGILCNPFLTNEILGSPIDGERRKILKAFLDDLYFEYRREYNDRLSPLDLLKEYWDYLMNWFDDPAKVKRIIKKAQGFDEYEEAVRKIFDERDASRQLIRELPTPYKTAQGT